MDRKSFQIVYQRDLYEKLSSRLLGDFYVKKSASTAIQFGSKPQGMMEQQQAGQSAFNPYSTGFYRPKFRLDPIADPVLFCSISLQFLPLQEGFNHFLQFITVFQSSCIPHCINPFNFCFLLIYLPRIIRSFFCLFSSATKIPFHMRMRSLLFKGFIKSK